MPDPRLGKRDLTVSLRDPRWWLTRCDVRETVASVPEPSFGYPSFEAYLRDMRLFKRRPPKHTESGVFCVLLFPDSAESRWVERLPPPGTRIRSRQGGAVWVVDVVLQSGRETYTVFCVDPREYSGARRRRPDGASDLAAELLEAARRTSETVTERSHRRRLRDYKP